VSTGLLIPDEVQSGQGGIWAYVSPSRLSCWLACPRRWAFRYIDRIETPTTPSLFVGSASHRALELYYRHRHLGITLEPGDVVRRLLESWSQLVDEENMKFGSVTEEQAFQRQVGDLVTVYLGHTPKDEKPLAVEVTVEAPLVDPVTGENVGIPLLGVMDLILDSQAGPLIVDFKTTARSAEPLEITHEIQLSSYAYLFRHVEQRQEARLEIRSLIKTKAAKVEFHSYPARTDGHFRRLFSVLREYLDAIDAGRFNYRPGFACAMCDFREQCQAWAG
jgi:putative RecB family exonuclease